MAVNPAEMEGRAARALETMLPSPPNPAGRNLPSARRSGLRWKSQRRVLRERNWNHHSVRKVQAIEALWMRAEGESVERGVFLSSA